MRGHQEFTKNFQEFAFYMYINATSFTYNTTLGLD